MADVKTQIRSVADIAKAAKALIASGVPDDDPRVNALRETYLRLVDPVEDGGQGLTPEQPLTWREFVSHYETANPGAAKTEQPAEAAGAVAGQKKDFWSALPIAAGRFVESTKQGIEQLAGAAGKTAAMTEAGIPLGMSPEELAAAGRGETVTFQPQASQFAVGGAPVPPPRTFTPSPTQAKVAGGLSSLATTLENKRKEEAQVYEAGIGSRNPAADIIGQGLASLAIPVGGAVAGNTARVLGREAADTASRGFVAGVKQGAAIGARQAPANAAISGVQYTPEAQDKAQNAAVAAIMSVGLGGASQAVRNLVYRVRNGDRLTPQELQVLEQAAAPAQTRAATGAPIPEEQVAAAKAAGVDITPDETTARTIAGEMSPAQSAEMVGRHLSPEEEAALPEVARQNLAIFRRFGYEPTPAQVMRDYKTMDEMATIAQSNAGPEGVAMREKLAQAKEIPGQVLRSRMAAGTDPTKAGPLAEATIAGVGRQVKDKIGAEYDAAAQAAESAGVSVMPENMIRTATENYADFNVKGAGTSSALYQKFASQLAKELDPEVRAKIDAQLKEQGLHEQLIGPARFQAYADALGSISPRTLEMMRKELNAAKAAPGSQDDEVLRRMKDAIRADTDAMPEDFYGKARKMAAENFGVLNEVPEIKAIGKGKVEAENMHKVLWGMSAKRWDITEEWIKRHGTSDQRAAWDATKGLMKDKVYQDILDAVESTTLNINGEREVMSASFDRAIKKFSSGGGYGRLEALIGKQGVEELGQLNRYLQLLEVPRTAKSASNPSGTAAKLIQRLDSWSTSGNPAKRGIANAIKNAGGKALEIFEESPEAIAKRTARTQLDTSAADSVRRRLIELQARKQAEQKMAGQSTLGDYTQFLFAPAMARPNTGQQ